MKNAFEQFWKLVLLTAMGSIGSIIAGLMSFGVEVFSPKGVGFAYVAFGLSGGFIFAFYHVRGLSNTITTAVTVSAVQFVASSFQLPIVNSAVWSFGANLPIVGLAFLFERKLATLKQAKFIVVGIVYGATFVLLTLLVGILTNIQHMPAAVFRENFLDGLYLGLGLGLGIEVGEAIVHSIELHKGSTQKQKPNTR